MQLLPPPPQANGQAKLQPNGDVLYTPNSGVTGVDTFQYDYCGGLNINAAGRAACGPATVTVTVIKPDPEAVRRLAARLAVAPDELLYLDDDATYVAGARQAGLQADRVGGAPDVQGSLTAHGLTTWRR